MMENQKIILDFETNVSLFIKREDLIHPFISGNKFRKLKFNIQQAEKENKKGLLTFGGAFSNHIAAVAYAGKENGFKTIGVIRGEELIYSIQENPTLKFSKECGMEFHFVTREKYRNKNNSEYLLELQKEFFTYFIIPEGGTNDLAIKGCEEILSHDDKCFDYICCAVGTGGTISGIINSSNDSQKILGFPALKGDFLQKDICKFAQKSNWELIQSYHFGGYAKVSIELINFINSFYKSTKIPLDCVYTSKMVYGVIEMIKNNYFKENSKILLIHTGGLQGNEGMNNWLENKNLPKIKFNV